MAYDIGPKIGIEGEQTFKSSLSAIDSQLKALGSGMKAVTSSFDENTSAEERARKKNELYQKTIAVTEEKIKLLIKQQDNEKEKLEKLARELESTTKQFGENSEQAVKAQNAYNKQAKTVADLENKINTAKTSINQMSKAENEAGDEAEQAEKKTKGWVEVLKGQLSADMITSGIKAIASAVKEIGSAFKECVTDAAAFADDILTLSSTTGLATDTLQEYQYMSDLVDVSLDTVTGSLTKLNKNMYSAKDGTGTAAESFATLGVAITDANGELRDNEDVFNDAITALGRISNESERDALAMTIFGKSAKDLNPLIEAGGEKLAQLTKEAHDVGYVLDGEALDALGSTQDAIDRLGVASTSLKNNLAVEFAPQINKALDMVVSGFQDLPRAFNVGGAEGLGESIGTTLGNVVNYIAEQAPAILDIADGLIEGLLTGVSEGLPDIVTAIVEFCPQLLESATELIPAIVMGLATAAPELIPATVDAVLLMVDTLTRPDTLVTLVDAGLQLVFGIIEGIGSAIPDLVGYVPILVTNVVATVMGLLPKVVSLGNNLIGSFIKGIGSKLASVGNMGSEIFNKFALSITTRLHQAVTWGKDLIQNFIDGIFSKWSGLKNSVTSIASLVKGFIGFSEPEEGPLSNFHTYAPDMMMLFSEGISKNSYLVTDAIKGVTDDVAGGFGGVDVYAMTSSNVNTTIHIDGKVTVEGVSNNDEFVSVADYLIEDNLARILREQVRL